MSDPSRTMLKSCNVCRTRIRELTVMRSRSRAFSSYILVMSGHSASKGIHWGSKWSLPREERSDCSTIYNASQTDVLLQEQRLQHSASAWGQCTLDIKASCLIRTHSFVNKTEVIACKVGMKVERYKQNWTIDYERIQQYFPIRNRVSKTWEKTQIFDDAFSAVLQIIQVLISRYTSSPVTYSWVSLLPTRAKQEASYVGGKINLE